MLCVLGLWTAWYGGHGPEILHVWFEDSLQPHQPASNPNTHACTWTDIITLHSITWTDMISACRGHGQSGMAVTGQRYCMSGLRTLCNLNSLHPLPMTQTTCYYMKVNAFCAGSMDSLVHYITWTDIISACRVYGQHGTAAMGLRYCMFGLRTPCNHISLHPLPMTWTTCPAPA